MCTSEKFWTRRSTLIICVAGLILVTIITLSICMSNTSSSDKLSASLPKVTTSTPIQSSISTTSNVSTSTPSTTPSKPSDNWKIVTRKEWGALSPTVTPIKLEVFPPTYVIISHTATSVCLDKETCIQSVRLIQNLHMFGKYWNDIGYNFLVGGDGNVYVGRGWEIEGAHTSGYNSKSIGISFIGDFTYKEPTKAQVDAALKFLTFGEKNKKLAMDYKLLGHRQVSNTLSPGEVLYNIIKTWKHWKATT